MSIRKLMLVFALAIGLSSVTSFAKPVILQVSILDNFAITPVSVNAVREFMVENLPDHKVIQVIVQGPEHDRYEDFFEGEQVIDVKRLLPPALREKISKEMAPDDVITNLIINTHGNTIKREGQDFTQLEGVGLIGSTSVDSDFNNVFSPVQGRFSPDAVVTFDACKTLCGTDEEAGRRAQTLLNYFGAPNGSVYGAYTNEEFIPASLQKKRNYRELILPKSTIKDLAVSSTFYATVPVAIMSMTNFHWLPFLRVEALGVSSLMGGLTGLNQFMHIVQPRVANFLGFRNRGRIFSFEDGNLVSVLKVKKIKDRFLAYGIDRVGSCKQSLNELIKN